MLSGCFLAVPLLLNPSHLIAQAALDLVTSRDDLAADKVVLFGRSLGGAVAIHLAAANPGKVSRLSTVQCAFDWLHLF